MDAAVAEPPAGSFVSPSAPPAAALSASSPAPLASPAVEEVTELSGGENNPWVCVVWDDPVNLMSYVTFVLQRTFGYDRGKAHDLMLAIHNEGKCAVASGSRDDMENAVRKLQEAGLWATLQKGE